MVEPSRVEVRPLMAEKSPRRVMLEERLADDPSDAFLRYALAVQPWRFSVCATATGTRAARGCGP
jgi:hypothetical protein